MTTFAECARCGADRPPDGACPECGYRPDLPPLWPVELPEVKRWRDAWHESSHCLAAVLLGAKLKPEGASIVPGRHFTGLAHIEGQPMPAATRRSGVCTLDQPREFRDWSERSMMWHLAGAQGEFLGGAVGRFDESLDELDRREALAISRRSPRHREVRAELDEKDPKGNPDQYQSEALSAALTADPGEPDLVTAAHMAWIGSEARRLLERHVGALAALADALFAAIEMTGPEIEAVIHAHPCECHHWPEVTP